MVGTPSHGGGVFQGRSELSEVVEMQPPAVARTNSAKPKRKKSRIARREQIIGIPSHEGFVKLNFQDLKRDQSDEADRGQKSQDGENFSRRHCPRPRLRVVSNRAGYPQLQAGTGH